MTMEEEYKYFLENCTKYAKSSNNYRDFHRIRKTLASIHNVDSFDVYDCTSAAEFEQLIAELEANDDFKEYNKKGNNQYSNALQMYLCFLRAKEFFSVAKNQNTVSPSSPLPQQIFYGAPGTGKSHTINLSTRGQAVVRTTFHPDSDYSTFVGAYKPTMRTVPLRDMSGHIVKDEATNKPVTEDRIVYEFVAQAFLKAYVAAWQKQAESAEPKLQFLVIEEINRGNCAQIFGDLFQLLDRNDHGFSDYPIQADNDMQRHLAQAFDGLQIPAADAINEQYGYDVVSQVLRGEILLLPANLLIWATMNTSDQSLFPIDSAFKRRWDWTYVPISDAHKGWVIKADGKRYDWWQFLTAINNKIGETTSSEDKKLGYFFCKAGPDGVISAETFVGKVIFYLWNDVFKDYEFADSIFNDGPEGGKLTFDKFHTTADQKAEVVQSKVRLFLSNLGLEPLEEGEIAGAEDSADDGMTFSVTFPDGEKIEESSKFMTYFRALQKIGLDKAEPIAAEKQYHRKGCPLVSKERFPEIDNDSTLRYEESDGYFVVRGIGNSAMCSFLRLLSERLSLSLDVVLQ